MAFGDVVQSVQGSSTSGEFTATFASGATTGNLIIFGGTLNQTLAGGSSWGDPTNFTTIHNVTVGSGNLGSAWWYKISTGGETTITSNITGESGNWCAALVEIEGPFAASPFDVSAENEANISTVVTSQSTGTTATTAQNDEVALAFFGADNGSNVSTTRAYTNSFTEVIFANSGARASSIIARKVLSATGTVECTFSTAGVGDEQYGSVAVFKKLVSAAGVKRLPLLGVG